MNLIEKTKNRLSLFYNRLPKKHPKLELEVGELVKGEVIKSLDSNKMSVRLKESIITAEIHGDLEPGDRIQVKVEKLEPKIVLNLVFRKNDLSSKIEVKA